jgi:hypothetical protein
MGAQEGEREREKLSSTRIRKKCSFNKHKTDVEKYPSIYRCWVIGISSYNFTMATTTTITKNSKERENY